MKKSLIIIFWIFLVIASNSLATTTTTTLIQRAEDIYCGSSPNAWTICLSFLRCRKYDAECQRTDEVGSDEESECHCKCVDGKIWSISDQKCILITTTTTTTFVSSTTSSTAIEAPEFNYFNIAFVILIAGVVLFYLRKK